MQRLSDVLFGFDVDVVREMMEISRTYPVWQGVKSVVDGRKTDYTSTGQSKLKMWKGVGGC